MTKVCITIDIECSIGGAFRDLTLFPVGTQAIWCNIEGRSQGLGFILETLRAEGIFGTFFLETNHTHYFTDSPMRRAAERIHCEGHDTQLHAHPCWSIFQSPDWREDLSERKRSDNSHGLSIAGSVEIIKHGLRKFNEWVLPTPLVFRSGNLQHDENLYRALSQCGIKTSSSVGLGIFDSGESKFQLNSGHHTFHGVSELPVLSYDDRLHWRRPSLKCLTIAGTSFLETCLLLQQAEIHGVPLVVVLTHPFEFIQKNDDQFTSMRPHSINQRRLRDLAKFLGENKTRFPCITMSTASRGFRELASPQNTLLQTPLFSSAIRKVCDGTYDKFGTFALRFL